MGFHHSHGVPFRGHLPIMGFLSLIYLTVVSALASAYAASQPWQIDTPQLLLLPSNAATTPRQQEVTFRVCSFVTVTRFILPLRTFRSRVVFVATTKNRRHGESEHSDSKLTCFFFLFFFLWMLRQKTKKRTYCRL